MGIIKFIVWTTLCVGAGIFLAGFEFKGRTPLQHLEREWHSNSPKLDKVKDGAEDLVDDVKKKLSTNAKDVGSAVSNAAGGAVNNVARPVEHHSSEDRDAIEKLIAKRAK